MAYEYIQLSTSEIEYGEKSLLNAELELLGAMKLSGSYHELRKQEINFKLQLKKKVGELKQNLAELEKCLPDVREEEHKEKKTNAYLQSKKVKPEEEPISPVQKNIQVKEVEETDAEKDAKRSLEQEIEEIQRKLRALH